MPKHKTTYVAIPENPTALSGLPDYYGIVDWTVEAWNVDHAARIVREREPRLADCKLALIPAAHLNLDR
jgi:hypothetical protein